jgi:uncharacterized protein (TIGR02246 family)
MSEVTDLIDAQVAAFRDKDLERFLNCYAADVTIFSGDGQVFMADREVMREQYGQLFSASPDLAVDIANRIAVGSVVVDEEHLQNFNAPGMPANFDAIVVYHVTDGKISQVTLLP